MNCLYKCLVVVSPFFRIFLSNLSLRSIILTVTKLEDVCQNKKALNWANALHVGSLENLGIWYFVLPSDAQKVSKAAQVARVKLSEVSTVHRPRFAGI